VEKYYRGSKATDDSTIRRRKYDVYMPDNTSKNINTSIKQGDQKVSVQLMISIHTSFLTHYLAQSNCFTANRQGQEDTRLTLTPSVIPNSNYFIMVSETVQNIFICFLYCNHQVHRDFLITLYLKCILLFHGNSC
jgi:hypothetical protein